MDIPSSTRLVMNKEICIYKNGILSTFDVIVVTQRDIE